MRYPGSCLCEPTQHHASIFLCSLLKRPGITLLICRVGEKRSVLLASDVADSICAVEQEA